MYKKGKSSHIFCIQWPCFWAAYQYRRYRCCVRATFGRKLDVTPKSHMPQSGKYQSSLLCGRWRFIRLMTTSCDKADQVATTCSSLAINKVRLRANLVLQGQFLLSSCKRHQIYLRYFSDDQYQAETILGCDSVARYRPDILNWSVSYLNKYPCYYSHMSIGLRPRKLKTKVEKGYSWKITSRDEV